MNAESLRARLKVIRATHNGLVDEMVAVVDAVEKRDIAAVDQAVARAEAGLVVYGEMAESVSTDLRSALIAFTALRTQEPARA